MTEIVSPHDVVRELSRIRAESEKGLALLKEAQLRYVELEIAADRIEDLAMLEAKGTVKDKEAISRLQASEAREQAEIAKVTVDYIKTKLRHLSESMMAIQTSARMVELQWKSAGIGER
jgi:hypothetical protein